MYPLYILFGNVCFSKNQFNKTVFRFLVLAFCRNVASNLLSTSSYSNPICFITVSLSFPSMIFYHFVTDIFYNTAHHSLPFSIVFCHLFIMLYHVPSSKCSIIFECLLVCTHGTCHLLLLFFKHIEAARIKMYPNKDFRIVHVDNQSLESFVVSCFSSRLTRKPQTQN